MIDPYRMVVINIIALLILLITLAVFKFIFHKKLSLTTILILFSILPVISVLRVGAYESGDFTLHL